MNHLLYHDLSLPPPDHESGPSIRLLRLKDTARHTAYELQVFPLQDSPKYKALSYCWGSPDHALSLRCNAVDIEITRNLHSALKHLELEYPGQLFWIDAICINQQDEVEKSHQVSIMRNIYSQAEEVLVWLDPSTLHKSTYLAISACEQYAAHARHYALWLVSQGDENSSFITDESVDMALRSRPLTGIESDALAQILRQPYWSRLWIIQEICVAKALRIHTGRLSIAWDDFEFILMMMERRMPHALLNLESNPRGLLQLRRKYHGKDQALRPSLAELLSLFRWSQAKVKVDKIYGLLGLVPDHERSFVKIEYNIPPAECYTQIMFSLLEKTRDLSLLINCNPPKFIRRRLILPSWVPDWSYDSSHLPPPRMGLRVSNLYHRMILNKKTIYQRCQASDNSECPTPRLVKGQHGLILSLQGIPTKGKINQIAPAMELHHQLLHIIDYQGIWEPSLFDRDENTNQYEWFRYVFRFFTTMPSITSVVNAPWNSYRNGAALDVLLISAGLAQSPGTWLGEEVDTLKVFFLTMMKGDQFDENNQDKIIDYPSQTTTQEMVDEFRDFQASLKWNMLLKLITLLGITHLYPAVYHFFLGLSYDQYRNVVNIDGIGITLLYVIINNLLNYFQIPFSLPFLLLNYGLYRSLSPLLKPTKTTCFDVLIPSVLDYALAKTSEGRLALVPYNTQVGDRIALLKGGRCPFVVRSHLGRWILVGDSYIYGMMEGEEWKESACEEIEFI